MGDYCYVVCYYFVIDDLCDVFVDWFSVFGGDCDCYDGYYV